VVAAFRRGQGVEIRQDRVCCRGLLGDTQAYAKIHQHRAERYGKSAAWRVAQQQTFSARRDRGPVSRQHGICQDNEPLPFIADDLFMTSDEQRVLPLLQILAELGRTTQVIAFTHHQHVVDIAMTLPAAGVQIHAMPATVQFPKLEQRTTSSAMDLALESVA